MQIANNFLKEKFYVKNFQIAKSILRAWANLDKYRTSHRLFLEGVDKNPFVFEI